jgi:hypothetical protein
MLLDGIIEVSSKAFELDGNWCGQQFYQGRSNHRFCCAEHSRKFHMAERRAALALFRSLKDEEEKDERRRMAS